MFCTLLTLLAVGAPATAMPADHDKDVPPRHADLFGGQAWYRDQPGKEQEFVGLLERNGKKGERTFSFGRMNPFRLIMERGEKRQVREVYSGGKPELLDPYVGKTVKLIGKAVDMEVEGTTHHEIWPARLELLR